MSTTALLAFALVALIGIATPGPTVLLALNNGSRYGVKRALAGMAGAVLSDFILIGAVALGLGALLAASEFWFALLKWIGVAYLAYLGIMLLRSNGAMVLPSGFPDKAGSPLALFRRCFLIAATNPKGYLFFSAFLPQFINPAEPQAPQYAVLGLIFTAIDFTVMLGYAALGSTALKFLRRSAILWLDRLCGGMLLALAGTLALMRRG